MVMITRADDPERNRPRIHLPRAPVPAFHPSPLPSRNAIPGTRPTLAPDPLAVVFTGPVELVRIQLQQDSTQGPAEWR